MHWEPCEVCGGNVIILDLKKTETGYRCAEECDEIEIETIGNGFRIPDVKVEFASNPLQRDHGFTQPEDGSERRFVFNAVKHGEKEPGLPQPVTVPWVKFRFWWAVHNAVAHPLIAIAPRKAFFQFHDWTSRKMHGR